jgi:class 3 adenylate cyclase/tetratricopeptide (TPR) repeat protein
MLLCERCGEENPDHARFCMACTSPLGGPSADATRRTVSIVFSDLAGSTALGESLDPEALREVLDSYFDAMRSVLERYGGTVEKYIGDAIMAVFGIPRAHEDDAIRAALAACAMRERLADLNAELEAAWGVRLTNRTGVHTGEVVTGDAATGLRLVTGDAVNTAARLEQAAPHGEILIGEPTYRLVAHAAVVDEVEPIAAKGKAEAVPAYLLRSIRPLQAIARRPTSRMVGRRDELETLVERFNAAVRDRRCSTATIVGEPGVGKSRLVAELAETLSPRARILSGRCLPYGEGMTYFAMSEIVREAAGIGEDESRGTAFERLRALLPGDERGAMIEDRLASAMGLSTQPYGKEELTWAFRKVIEHLARERPLLIVVDDVQWADPALLETVETIVAVASDAPALIMCVARPEFLERTDIEPSSSEFPPILLEPLGSSDVRELIAALLNLERTPTTLIGRIEEAAQGNPLFVEQLIEAWRDAGGLTDDGSIANADTLPVPPTIQALLRSRLDLLPIDQRSILERGSVVGQVFYRDAVSELGSEPEPDDLDDRLERLGSRRFLRSDVSPFEGDQAWAFVHLLVRDATYEGMLKRARSELHERFAGWLSDRAGDRLPEFEEIVGYHLEQAYVLRRELGPLDDAAIQLGARAAEVLERCAQRATQVSRVSAAVGFLERAAGCLPTDSPEFAHTLIRAMESCMWMGDLGKLDTIRDGFPEISGVTGRAGAIRLAVTEVWTRAMRSGEPGAALLDEARSHTADLRSADDLEGQTWSLRLEAMLLGWLGRAADSRAASREGAELARRIGRLDLELDARTHDAMTSIYDSSPVRLSIKSCEDVLALYRGDRSFEVSLLRPLGVLYAMAGEFDRAHECLDRALEIRQELGPASGASSMYDAGWRAQVAVAEADPIAAERELRPAYEMARSMDETGLRSSWAAGLAQALVAQGRLDEALALAEESRELAADDDYDAQSRWRQAVSLVLAAKGGGEEAITLAREAVAIVDATEDTMMRGDSLVVLGEALSVAGRNREAADALRQAIGCYERKGVLTAARQARSRLEELLSATPEAKWDRG